jgi:hypothetical protein
MNASTVQQKQLEEDLGRLEVGIRQLKVQYDMFMAGALKTEPSELRSRLEKIIRKHSNQSIGKYSQSFRFNALVSRFNSFAELWGKRVRSMEEGNFRHTGVAERLGIRERLVARCRVSDPEESRRDLKRLHSRYVDAQRRQGIVEGRLPSFESFLRGIESQTERLRREAGCEAIELRVIERDDSIQVKARPGR